MLVVAAGYLVAFVGGLVGLVLGVLRLPIVYFLLPTPWIAAGTNVGVSTLGALSGSYRHLREGRVDFNLVLYMGAGSVVGGFIGGFYSKAVPASILLLIMAAVVGWQGFDFAFQQTSTLANRGLAGPPATKLIFQELVIGFLVGVLGGMVGLILGSIRLPAMVKILNVSMKVAVGTNMTIGLLQGIFSSVGHVLNGNIELALLLAMGVASIIGGYHGAAFTGRISPISLKRAIGLVLLVVAVAMLWSGLTR